MSNRLKFLQALIVSLILVVVEGRPQILVPTHNNRTNNGRLQKISLLKLV